MNARCIHPRRVSFSFTIVPFIAEFYSPDQTMISFPPGTRRHITARASQQGLRLITDWAMTKPS
jgi:hypothetical protein